MMDLPGAKEALEEAVVQGVFPGAVLLVGRKNRILFHHAVGFKSLIPVKTPMTMRTVFDLSSLTKPIATATAVMLMVHDGRVRPDDRYSDFFPELRRGEKEDITFRHLLSHCSGLPAWRPFYEDYKEFVDDRWGAAAGSRTKDLVWKRIQQEELLSRPGERCLYSDLGFILLGEAVERLNGCDLEDYCRKRIFAPMGLHSTFFVNLASRRPTFLDRIAPTEECPWRRKVLLGEVHDDNAYAMGGVAGHAGLFSCAADLHRFLTLLRRCYDGECPMLASSIVRNFLARNQAVEGGTYAMGWDTPTHENSSSGHHFSTHSVGHLGFTGTSIWWDLDRDLHVILLSNRVHPSRDNEKIRAFRPLVHDLVLEAVLK